MIRSFGDGNCKVYVIDLKKYRELMRTLRKVQQHHKRILKSDDFRRLSHTIRDITKRLEQNHKRIVEGIGK